MLDQNTPLVAFTHTGGGHTLHENAVRSLTEDGKRVVAWAETLPARQHAAVATAFTRLKLSVQDFCAGTMSLSEYNGIAGGNGPSRYDFFTGMYFDYGQGNDGVVICTDESLLVHKPVKGVDHAPAHK